MKRHLYIISLLVIVQFSFAQKQNLKTPKNLKRAVEILSETCPDSLQIIIKNKPDEDFRDFYYKNWKASFRNVHRWISYDTEETKLERYFRKKGIEIEENQITILFIAYKHHLLNTPINEARIIEPYKALEEEKRIEMEVLYVADTIDGEYIPKDLEDCYRQIDLFLNDSTKIAIRNQSEEDFIADSHFGRGKWIRNNWQLWKGSRLSKYFNEMKIYHPDDMSGIIHRGYYCYLTGKKFKLKEQIKHYQHHWKIVKAPKIEMYPKGIYEEFDFDYMFYDLENNLNGCLRIQSNTKSEKSGYMTIT